MQCWPIFWVNALPSGHRQKDKMFYHLPPAGSPVLWTPSLTSSVEVRKRFKPYATCFYHSGAESLAAAILSIVSHKAVNAPEVMLSAYACPELVSAILYAGAKPILVDLEPQQPWININDLKNKISKNTVALIAVNLFGIAEQLEEISEICNKHKIVLIEDSAQSFPKITDDRFWKGDFIVLSFGRGKPVSTLGGGALLYRHHDVIKCFSENSTGDEKISALKLLKYRVKIFLYNLLLHPRLYFIPASLPFLKLGETRFTPLQKIKPMAEENLSILDANIENYLRTKNNKRQQWLSDIVSELKLIDLPKQCCGQNNPPVLLRYPVLAASRKQRDELYHKLNQAGLGVSKMYQRPLNKIQGLEDIFREQGEFPNAAEFAERLLTLPVHKGLTLNVAQKLKEYIQA